MNIETIEIILRSEQKISESSLSRLLSIFLKIHIPVLNIKNTTNNETHNIYELQSVHTIDDIFSENSMVIANYISTIKSLIEIHISNKTIHNINKHIEELTKILIHNKTSLTINKKNIFTPSKKIDKLHSEEKTNTNQENNLEKKLSQSNSIESKISDIEIDFINSRIKSKIEINGKNTPKNIETTEKFRSLIKNLRNINAIGKINFEKNIDSYVLSTHSDIEDDYIKKIVHTLSAYLSENSQLF